VKRDRYINILRYDFTPPVTRAVRRLSARKGIEMDINVAREVAARIWCDQEMSHIVMDTVLAEEIAQLLVSRLTQRAADVCPVCDGKGWLGKNIWNSEECAECIGTGKRG
jgi:hypothetical protein